MFVKLIYRLCSPLAKTLPHNSDVDIKELGLLQATTPLREHES